jgi:hypothetical protein
VFSFHAAEAGVGGLKMTILPRGGPMGQAFSEIENNFTYHAPKPGQSEIYEQIRAKAKEFAYLLEEFCPHGRERAVAITHLETAVFWANASIARQK